MKLKPLETNTMPVMRVVRKQPTKKKPEPEPEPVLQEEASAEPVVLSEEVLVEPILQKEVPEETVVLQEEATPPIDKTQILRRFCQKVQMDKEYYQTHHPKLWSLYQELEELVRE